MILPRPHVPEICHRPFMVNGAAREYEAFSPSRLHVFAPGGGGAPRRIAPATSRARAVERRLPAMPRSGPLRSADPLPATPHRAPTRAFAASFLAPHNAAPARATPIRGGSRAHGVLR